MQKRQRGQSLSESPADTGVDCRDFNCGGGNVG